MSAVHSLQEAAGQWKIRGFFALPRHRDLTTDVCSGKMPDTEAAAVVAANLSQDLNQFDSALHFDNCAFAEGADKYRFWWGVVKGTGSSSEASDFFGKILHLVQDFYSHSNWVELHAQSAPLPLFAIGTQPPSGLVSGTYFLGRPKRCGDAPSHDDLNKDAPDSKQGAKQIDQGPNKGRTLFDLAYDCAKRHSELEVAQFIAARQARPTFLTSSVAEPVPGSASSKARLTTLGAVNMASRARVRIDSIRVQKSESYGVFGEPGGSAEWRLFITVNAEQRLWAADGVRDASDHVLGWDFLVPIENDSTTISVRSAGHEVDDSSANDQLPGAERTFGKGDNWGIGGTHNMRGVSEDFDYTVYFTISAVQTLLRSVIPKELAIAAIRERREAKGRSATVYDSELVTMFVNKAEANGLTLVTMDDQNLLFEGVEPVTAFALRQFPAVASAVRTRFALK